MHPSHHFSPTADPPSPGSQGQSDISSEATSPNACEFSGPFGNLSYIVAPLGRAYPHPDRIVTFGNYYDTVEGDIDESARREGLLAVEALLPTANPSQEMIWSIVKCGLANQTEEAWSLLSCSKFAPSSYETVCVEVLRCTLNPHIPFQTEIYSRDFDSRIRFLSLEYELVRALREPRLDQAMELTERMMEITGSDMALEDLFARIVYLYCSPEGKARCRLQKAMENAWIRAEKQSTRVPEGWIQFTEDLNFT